MKNSKILAEWLDKDGNKVQLNTPSTTSNTPSNGLFKDRFMKLVKHIEDYFSWSTVYYVSDCELELEFGSGYDVFNLVIDVNSTAIDLIVTNIKMHKEIVKATVGHNDWPKILSILEANDFISNKKFCEWLDSNGNKVSLNNNTTAGMSDYSSIFNKLLKHIESTTGVAKIIDMKPFAFTAAVGNGTELNIARVVSSASDKSVTLYCKFRVSLYNSTRNTYLINKVFDNWYSMLDALFRHGIITDKTVCESVRLSTIDEFKLYENLWESSNEPQYDYKHENGVYNVYKDGKYILSCEHRWEIDKEIAEYEEDQTAKQQASKNKYRVSWSIIDRKDRRQDFSVNDILASNEIEARALANIPDDPHVRNITVIKL